jgi:uncharacterized membrane protein
MIVLFLIISISFVFLTALHILHITGIKENPRRANNEYSDMVQHEYKELREAYVSGEISLVAYEQRLEEIDLTEVN